MQKNLFTIYKYKKYFQIFKLFIGFIPKTPTYIINLKNFLKTKELKYLKRRKFNKNKYLDNF